MSLRHGARGLSMTLAGLTAASILGVVAYAAAALPGERVERVAGIAFIAGWVAHGAAIALDVLGATDGARFGFAPALSVTLWLVVAVYGIESRLVPIARVRRVLAALGVAVLLLCLAFPGDVYAQHAALAPLHWLLGIASYGLFGAAVLHAGMLASADRQMRNHAPAAAARAPGLPLLRIERLTFQFVTAGFAALTATLLLGWWVTPAWHWDHKTVFSVLAWLVFGALLAGRAAFGWRGRRATRGVYAGAVLLLLAYVGSRFVLEVLLRRPTA